MKSYAKQQAIAESQSLETRLQSTSARTEADLKEKLKNLETRVLELDSGVETSPRKVGRWSDGAVTQLMRGEVTQSRSEGVCDITHNLTLWVFIASHMQNQLQILRTNRPQLLGLSGRPVEHRGISALRSAMGFVAGDNVRVGDRTVTVQESNGHAVKVDGRWLHSEEVEALPTMGSGPYHARFQQTMLRIKARSLCFLLGGGWATR
eukprot:g31756.t1